MWIRQDTAVSTVLRVAVLRYRCVFTQTNTGERSDNVINSHDLSAVLTWREFIKRFGACLKIAGDSRIEKRDVASSRLRCLVRQI